MWQSTLGSVCTGAVISRHIQSDLLCWLKPVTLFFLFCFCRRRHEQAALFGSNQREAAEAHQPNLQPATDKTALGQSADGTHDSIDLCINTSAETSAGPEGDQPKGDAPGGGGQASAGHRQSDQQGAGAKQAQTHSSMPMQQRGSGRGEGKGSEQSDGALLETSKGSSRQDCAKPPSSAAGNIHFP